MNKIIRNYQGLVLTAMSVLLTFSCSDDDSGADLTDVSFSQAEVTQILNIDDLTGATDELIIGLFTGTTLTGKTRPECVVTTATDNGYTMTFTDCVIDGSETINGTLVVAYTAQTEQSIAVAITFNDFSVGAVQISGTRSFSFAAPGMDQTSFSFEVTSDMTVTLEDGTVITETGNRTLGFVFGDPAGGSGAFTIDGNLTITVDDNTYSVVVDTTLEQSFGCNYFGSGIMTLGKNGLQLTVDFGDGTCDNTATLTYPDGTTEDYNLDS